MTRTTLKLTPKPAKKASRKPAKPTSRVMRSEIARNLQRAKREEAPKPATPAVAPPPEPKPRPAPIRTERRRQAPRPHDQERRPSPPPRAPSDDDRPRLSKLMADRGIASRREADEWIANGWVRVNGEVTSTLGTRVDPSVSIEIDAAATKDQAERVTILLNKPIGYVSGQAEDGYEPAVVLVTPENRWEEDPSRMPFRRGHLRGLAPAGRLDIDSTGLLVLTQDGRIARKLIGEDSDVEKEYLVRVEGTLDERGLALLRHGLSLDGVALKPAQVSWQNEDQLRFALREGRKRQIRRMCEAVGLKVVGLRRIRIGSIPLGKLPVGKWRYLNRGERF